MRWPPQLIALIGSSVFILAASLPDPRAPIHRIVAVGDLHGDFSAWRDIARAAGLENEAGHWIGGATVLVQTGDVVDRGPASLPIIRDLMLLQREAPRTGGRVIALIGNHEAMNMLDDLRYVSAGDYASFATPSSPRVREHAFLTHRATIAAAYRASDPSLTDEAIHKKWSEATPLGEIEHQIAWHPEGAIGRWVRTNPAVVILGGTLFVHGGLSAAYSCLSVPEINRRVDAALTAQDRRPEAIINDPRGPLWYRGYVVGADDEPGEGPDASPPCPANIASASATSPGAELSAVLRDQQASRMVIGHTPILSGIAIEDDGKLIRIDTGISSYYGGTVSYLELLDGAALEHVVTRSTPAASTGGTRP